MPAANVQMPFVAKKSLQRRLLLGFVGCAAMLWVGLVSWGLYTTFTAGERDTAIELERYAKQVLAVAVELKGSPTALQRALGKIEQVENLLDADEVGDDDNTQLIFQAWVDGKLVTLPATMLQTDQQPPPDDLPTTAGFEIIQAGETVWWTAVAVHSEQGVVVRLADSSTLHGSIGSEQGFFFFLPLVVSLPLLLFPAWFMTRFGLQPLGTIAAELQTRVASGELHPLQPTAYRELNPVVQATNDLMQRLGIQLQRERALVADVAHQLKTPLAIIQMNAERLEVNLKLQAEQQGDSLRALGDLLAGVSRSDRLIHQLLRMARLEQGATQEAQLRRIDLAEFTRERVAHSEPLARAKGLHLLVDAPHQPSVVVYIDAFAAIVDNLLDNAIKYSQPGGTIQIHCSLQAEECLLVISDEGCGIASVDQEEAFTRFARLGAEQAQDLVPGAGLGLSIVKQAVQQLRGKVQLADVAIGQGLRVEVRFPIDLGSAEDASKA